MMTIIFTLGCQNQNKESLQEYQDTLYSISNDIFRITYKSDIDDLTNIVKLLIDVNEENYLTQIPYIKGKISSFEEESHSIY
ncbi:hypothetical protein, partial [Alkalibaculum sporogenes]|uniref:hypothetical protein n=1 Tax=Alkalibaculum sporogenes TaxID=2655001 RepID=UPI001A9BB3C3